MKIKEILIIEKDNFENINLFKEGLFWRCYEYSAWRFFFNIKAYRVLKKYIKAVKQDIVYLGFPENILEDIMQNAVEKDYTVKKSETEIIMNPNPTGSEAPRKDPTGNEAPVGSGTESVGFEQWKAEIELITGKEKLNDCLLARQGSKQDEIIRKIKEYPVANRTPLETPEFLAKIQKEIIESIKL